MKAFLIFICLFGFHSNVLIAQSMDECNIYGKALAYLKADFENNHKEQYQNSLLSDTVDKDTFFELNDSTVFSMLFYIREYIFKVDSFNFKSTYNLIAKDDTSRNMDGVTVSTLDTINCDFPEFEHFYVNEANKSRLVEENRDKVNNISENTILAIVSLQFSKIFFKGDKAYFYVLQLTGIRGTYMIIMSFSLQKDPDNNWQIIKYYGEAK